MNAAREVSSKSDATIDRETAITWAARAVACYKRYRTTGDVYWLLRADRFKHEAIEHAGGVSGKFRDAIKRRIAKQSKHRAKRRFR